MTRQLNRIKIGINSSEEKRLKLLASQFAEEANEILTNTKIFGTDYPIELSKIPVWLNKTLSEGKEYVPEQAARLLGLEHQYRFIITTIEDLQDSSNYQRFRAFLKFDGKKYILDSKVDTYIKDLVTEYLEGDRPISMYFETQKLIDQYMHLADIAGLSNNGWFDRDKKRFANSTELIHCDTSFELKPSAQTIREKYS